MENLAERIHEATVLIADHDADILTLLRLQLKRSGYTKVTCASDSEHALEIIDAFRRKGAEFDLFMLDVMLPVYDGYEICRKIRELSQAPVILLAAHVGETERERVRELENVEFLVKPFPLESVDLLVEKALTKHLLVREIRQSNAKNQQLFLNVLQVVMNTMSATHKFHEEHSRNVATIVRKIAKAMEFPPREISLLGIAGAFHDIGMLSVDEAILQKPGKLSRDEFAVVKEHTKVSSSILEPIQDLSAVLTTIQHHHECWDGSGYPDGLKGDNIPMGARILCIADSYNAMTTKRPYRTEPLSHEEALARISEGAGTQFDPNIVAVFTQKVKFA
jgi:putative two-component system response regulator